MKKKNCAFCGKEIVGYGNNPSPFTTKGEVCDECNTRYVIPARLANYGVRDYSTTKLYCLHYLPYSVNSKLNETCKMSVHELKSWQQSLKDETQELAVKTNKLQDYMRTEQYYELTRNEKDLLYMQLHAMLAYLEALGKRCEYYDIELDIKEINK